MLQVILWPTQSILCINWEVSAMQATWLILELKHQIALGQWCLSILESLTSVDIDIWLWFSGCRYSSDDLIWAEMPENKLGNSDPIFYNL